MVSSACARSVGTRTQVAQMRTVSRSHMRRVSVTSLRSSSLKPSSPTCEVWLKTLKRYCRPKIEVSMAAPVANARACDSSSSIAAAPAPDAAW